MEMNMEWNPTLTRVMVNTKGHSKTEIYIKGRAARRDQQLQVLESYPDGSCRVCFSTRIVVEETTKTLMAFCVHCVDC